PPAPAPVTGKTGPEPAKATPPTREAPAAPTGTTPSAPAAPTTDRATITVKLPPGATLYVDDKKSPSKDAVRQFATPPLPAGREFAYQLKAEIVRDGQPETLTQKVPFRAGERIVVDFTSLGGK
ncbi:MAG: TIGR03000 domain-containing protein, partial [Gemmata sp.]